MEDAGPFWIIFGILCLAFVIFIVFLQMDDCTKKGGILTTDITGLQMICVEEKK